MAEIVNNFMIIEFSRMASSAVRCRSLRFLKYHSRIVKVPLLWTCPFGHYIYILLHMKT